LIDNQLYIVAVRTKYRPM